MMRVQGTKLYYWDADRGCHIALNGLRVGDRLLVFDEPEVEPDEVAKAAENETLYWLTNRLEALEGDMKQVWEHLSAKHRGEGGE